MVKSLVGTVNWQAPELWVAHPRYVSALLFFTLFFSPISIWQVELKGLLWGGSQE